MTFTAAVPMRVRIDIEEKGTTMFLAGVVSEMGCEVWAPPQEESCDIVITTPDLMARGVCADPTDPLLPIVILWGLEAGSDLRPWLRAGVFDFLPPEADSQSTREVLAEAIKRRSEQIRRLQSLREMKERHRDLATIIRLTVEMGAELNVDRVLEHIVEQLSGVLGYQIVSIMLLDPGERFLSIRASRGLSERVVSASRVEVGKGVSGTVAATGEALLIEDIENDPRFGKVRSHSRYSSKSLVCIPLKVGNRVIGVLNSNNRRQSGVMTRYDLDLLGAFAAQASVNIERARLYRNLENQARELSVAYDRLKAVDQIKSDFITNVSHEYRTPVTIIMGYLELLRGGMRDPVQLEKVDISLRAAQRLSRLIDDSTDLLRLDSDAMSFSLRPTPVDGVVQSSIQDFWARFVSRGVELLVDLPEGLPEVSVDLDKIRKAVEKLLDNALKFTPKGGYVKVSAFAREDRVFLAVEDSGPGIPSTDRERVFQRFEQGGDIMTSKPEGTGLGLPIARTIVSRHGGNLEIDSDFKEGCRILLSLPVAR